MFRTQSLFRFGRTAVLAGLLILVLVLAVTAAPDKLGIPAPDFSTYYGGSTEECLFDRCAITHDSEGNLIITGTTRSQNFPTKNAYMVDSPDGSGDDIFLVKLTPDGQTVLFSTYIGNGQARDVAVDSEDNIVIAGSTDDENFLTTTGAIQDCNVSAVKAVVVKMSADGQILLYSTCLRGDKPSKAYGVDVDANDNILVAGYTLASDFPTKNPVQNTNKGAEDAFVSKIAADGKSLLFSTYLGGSGRDYAWDVSTDAQGNAYVGGRSSKPDEFPQTAGVVGPDKPNGTAVVFKINSNGSLGYSTAIGEVTDEATMVEADEEGYLYFLWDNFNGVGKLNKDASAFVYRTEVDMEISEGAHYGGLTIDNEGNAYVTGRVNSTANGKDIVVAALNEKGLQVFYDTIGGAADDAGHGITVRKQPDGTIEATMAGTTQSDNFPLLNPLQNNLNGAMDMIIFNVTGLETAVNRWYVMLPVVITAK